jgi:predicted O-methyltransferase YrrM
MLGRLYTAIASAVGDPVVIEVGTAFGVSGMYWLAGIGTGHLHTFEPNADWASIARRNLESISGQFTLTEAPFEDHASTLPPADIAFVDAIHTSLFVERQFALLRPLMKPRGIVVFDDINFSADMSSCWQRIARDPAVLASASIGGRVGIVELTS